MTERMRSQVQASEMRFLRRIEGVTLFNKVRSSEIRKALNIEPLLLRIERSQLRLFDHVSRMPQERLPKRALLAKASGRRAVGRPRTKWTDYIEDLGWNRLGLHPSEMMEVMEDREVWRLNLELLPPQPSRKSGQWRKKTCALYSWFVALALSAPALSLERTCPRKVGPWPPIFLCPWLWPRALCSRLQIWILFSLFFPSSSGWEDRFRVFLNFLVEYLFVFIDNLRYLQPQFQNQSKFFF